MSVLVLKENQRFEESQVVQEVHELWDLKLTQKNFWDANPDRNQDAPQTRYSHTPIPSRRCFILWAKHIQEAVSFEACLESCAFCAEPALWIFVAMRLQCAEYAAPSAWHDHVRRGFRTIWGGGSDYLGHGPWILIDFILATKDWGSVSQSRNRTSSLPCLQSPIRLLAMSFRGFGSCLSSLVSHLQRLHMGLPAATG